MRKVALIILDGWGIGETHRNNAIHHARTPFYDKLIASCPHTTLQASGEYVGLPVGQIGGSEVGHLTIGAGRVIYQDLPRINHAFEDGSILQVDSFKKFIEAAGAHRAHLIGLLSPGGIHSHEDHLYSLLHIMKNQGCKSPFIHVISDGRDTPVQSGRISAKRLTQCIRDLEYGEIATLSGRFYAMDRDSNADRTSTAARVICAASEDSVANIDTAFEMSYASDVTDEFIKPVVVSSAYEGIAEDEPIFFVNFRSDRMRQLVTAVHESCPDNPIYTMTQYDKTYKYPVIFSKQHVENTLGQVISEHGLKQIRIAETEKYAHVTYFFNGGVDVIYDGEIRGIIKSNSVRHDQMPHMKAAEIREKVQQLVVEHDPAFVLINIANSDMVGHTGNYKAVTEAIEKVDEELEKICTYLTESGYICCITSDHGNADIMYNPATQEIHTSHTGNPVPFVVYDPRHLAGRHITLSSRPANSLHMIAGTILQLMKLSSAHMKYESLLPSDA